MTVDLAGTWRLTDAPGEHACDMVLPGDIVSALHAAGLIPDPYHGRNEYDLRWISERDWTATKVVTIDDPDVDLAIDGLDTVASVRVNGQVVLDGRNAFRRYRVKDTDPHAIWWPSSPTPGPLSFGDAWHDDANGDMHFWSVWHEGRDFDHYRDVAPRFCSEFGFQSYPSMEVIRRFADPADFNISAPVFESHQKNAGGNARIAETMFRYFRWPERFENFVWLSQVQQGLAIKTAVTDWRTRKPRCMGTLIWQLNDTWPVCSWSSIDHGGVWKLLHHMARSFFRPAMVTAVPRDGRLMLIGVNDGRDPLDMTVTAYATAMDGTARELGQGAAPVGGGAVTLMDLDPDAVGPDEMLTYGWTASDGTRGGDVFAPRPYKAYDLPDPGLTSTVTRDGDDWDIAITAQAMAFFVTAEADVPGRYEANAIHLGPGHTAHLRFTSQVSGAAPTFILRDLYSATVARHS